MNIRVRELKNSFYTKRNAILTICLFFFLSYIFLISLKQTHKSLVINEYDVDLVLGLNKPRVNVEKNGNDFKKAKLSNYLLKLLNIKKITDDVRLVEDETIPLYPWEQIDEKEDRVLNQLRFIPQNYNMKTKMQNPKKFVIVGPTMKNYPPINNMQICPVGACTFSFDQSLAPTADVLIYFAVNRRLAHKRPRNQIWASLISESPYHIGSSNFRKNELNWTVNYRRDATVQFPYFKYYQHDMTKEKPERHPVPMNNYAYGKTRLVASFVSNCYSQNERNDVIKELGNHIQVDVYGKCGTLKCPRSEECLQKLKQEYKFYLAFENSNCRDYITEKFFQNALQHDVLPIVMGAHPEDYKRAAPPYSYIHIEQFKTLKELAKYLLYLDKNETAYNEYFGWKEHGNIIEETYIDCRMCMLAHQAESSTSIVNDLILWHLKGKYNDQHVEFYSTEMCIGSKRWDEV